MKKYNYILKLAAATMIAGSLFMGCGSGSADSGSKADSAESTDDKQEKSSEVDVDALVKSLISDVTYEAELSDCSSDVENYMTVEEGVTSVMYMTSGSYEEVAVFTAPDEATAATMKDDVSEFLSEQKSAAEDYEPAAAQRIDNAVLVVKGNYVVLCVSGDSDKAQEIINNAFN